MNVPSLTISYSLQTYNNLGRIRSGDNKYSNLVKVGACARRNQIYFTVHFLRMYVDYVCRPYVPLYRLYNLVDIRYKVSLIISVKLPGLLITITIT